MDKRWNLNRPPAWCFPQSVSRNTGRRSNLLAAPSEQQRNTRPGRLQFGRFDVAICCIRRTANLLGGHELEICRKYTNLFQVKFFSYNLEESRLAITAVVRIRNAIPPFVHSVGSRYLN